MGHGRLPFADVCDAHTPRLLMIRCRVEFLEAGVSSVVEEHVVGVFPGIGEASPPLLLLPAVGSAKGKNMDFSPTLPPQQSPPPCHALGSRSRTEPCRRLRQSAGSQSPDRNQHLRTWQQLEGNPGRAKKQGKGLKLAKVLHGDKSKTWLNES